MLCPQLLLIDRQGARVQRFGLLVSTMSDQVVSCLAEKRGSLWKVEGIFIDEVNTSKGMRKQAFTLLPQRDIEHIRKGQIDSSRASLCPF